MKNLVLGVLTDETEKPVYHEELTWQNKLGIYLLLLENDSVIDADPIITDFYDSCFVSNMGKLIRASSQFSDIENNLMSGSGYDYLDSLENMSSTILPESTLLEVLTIAFTKQLDTNIYSTPSIQTPQTILLTSTLAGMSPDTTFVVEANTNSYTYNQRIALEEVAQQCPFEYGSGVYMARAMLSQMDTIVYQYRNECEFAGWGSGKWDGHENETVNENEEYTTTTADETVNVMVFPNPATNELYISIAGAERSVIKFEMWTTVGQRVKAENLKTGFNVITVNELSSGIYHYTVSVNDVFKKTGKQVISK